MAPSRSPLAKGQACAACKARKVKCCSTRPACTACVRAARYKGLDTSQVVCEYRGNEPASPITLPLASRSRGKEAALTLEDPSRLRPLAYTTPSPGSSAPTSPAPMLEWAKPSVSSSSLVYVPYKVDFAPVEAAATPATHEPAKTSADDVWRAELEPALLSGYAPSEQYDASGPSSISSSDGFGSFGDLSSTGTLDQPSFYSFFASDLSPYTSQLAGFDGSFA